ncbi:hypothetical protein LARV_03410 [Longilinea arvoryzae]|uniref:Uncharacterized protein n=1 Tax=Longilinea arvoryzae TaxID=360412 RepID=A0A0S7BMX8_9CHLR|nr:hypothetical protein [Longilinea arvoryzae]GAP15618.1 hypothetical protein LARV_03410 [Longilinea arvoryzae]
MQPSSVYLILAVICVIVGFIGGALVSTLFSEREKKQMRSEGDLLPEGIDREQYTQRLRLWRDADGALVTELRGRILTDIKQASTAQRLELEEITDQWQNWLGVRLNVTRPAAQPEPQPAPAEKPVVQPVVVPHQPEMPNSNPDNGILVKTPDGGGSMVDQINDILQEGLVHTRLQHSVKITQDLREGIIVWLDGGRYVGVDEVPDPDVKKLIRAAAAEWERRSETPK